LIGKIMKNSEKTEQKRKTPLIFGGILPIVLALIIEKFFEAFTNLISNYGNINFPFVFVAIGFMSFLIYTAYELVGWFQDPSDQPIKQDSGFEIARYVTWFLEYLVIYDIVRLFGSSKPSLYSPTAEIALRFAILFAMYFLYNFWHWLEFKTSQKQNTLEVRNAYKKNTRNVFRVYPLLVIANFTFWLVLINSSSIVFEYAYAIMLLFTPVAFIVSFRIIKS